MTYEQRRIASKIGESQRREQRYGGYGVYKVGSFLYRNAFVTISKEDGLWTLHVISEAPIGLPLIKEVRYKYLPNNLMMAQIFGDRAEANEIKGVILYQIPNGEMEAE